MISEPIVTPVRNPKRKVTWLRVLAGIAAFLLLLIVIVIAIPDSVWKRIIVSQVTKATGRQAAIDGDLKLHLLTFNPELIIERFSLANPEWAHTKNMLEVQRFDVVVSLWSLLKFDPAFPRIAIDTPVIDLEREGSGRANWDFSTAGAQKPKPAQTSKPLHIPVIQNLSINNGKLRADDRIAKLKFDGELSIAEKQNTSDDKALNVHGNGSLNGKPFELKVAGPPLLNVDSSKPYDFETSVTAADIKLSAQAEVLKPFDLAAVTSKFHLSGNDLADFYYLTGLALPNTPPYDISGTAVRNGLKFQIDDLHGRLGGSDISGKLGIDASIKRPKLTAQLISKELNLADLAAPLGTDATPEKKSGSLSQSPDAKSKPPAQPGAPPPPNALLLPDADLQVDRVRAMDADVTFDAASIVANKLPMKKVRFHLLLDNGKLTLDPLTFSLPEGTFSGTVGINARQKIPVTDIDMKLVNVDLTQFKPASSSTTNAPFEGQMVGRIKLRGTGTSVHKAAATVNGDITVVIPNGEIRDSFAELTGINISRALGLLFTKNEQNTVLRCGVVSFHADDGEMKATTILVDTTHVIITGKGDIDLKNEAIDMSLGGQPKGPRLLRLRSPITVHGTLAHPLPGLKAANVAEQAGAAVALGILLTPVASILAFVDPGLGKDANCAAVLGQAEQDKGLPPLPN